jgi:ABC-2 type transport system permease protein
VIGRIRAILVKEFRQIGRDRRSLGVLLFLPLFLLVMFGYAVSLDVRHVPLAVYDGDSSPQSRRLIEGFRHSEYFNLKYELASTAPIDQLLARERARAVLVIPRGFSRRLSRGQTCQVQVLLDGSNASSASTALGYIEVVIQQFAAGLTTGSLLRLGTARYRPPVDFRPRVWFNPELSSSVYLVPGLVTFILAISAVISTALSIVREKERGTMEQILVSPIRPLELIVGKTIPYAAVSLAVTVAVLAASYLLFGVQIRGSYLLLLLVILLFLLACLGLGLLISTLVATQQMAFTVSGLITVLPTFILSGFVFPIRNMPPAIQAVTFLFPARFFLAALRSVIIKGTGLAAFWEQALGLGIFAFGTLALSTLRMRATARAARGPA